jgi:type IV pilus assembly protein PilC
MNNMIALLKGWTKRAPQIARVGGRTVQSSTFFLSYPVKERIVFAKRLSMLLRSGMPILTSIRMLYEEASSSSAKKIIGSIVDDLSNGLSLTNAMRRFERIFGPFTLNIIRVGETSGSLSDNLEYIATELRKKHELRKKVIGSLIYPAIIVLATVGITVMLIVYIFPKILPIFLSLKSELPWSTQVLIALSGFLSQHGLMLFGGIVIVAIGFVWAMRSSRFHFYVDHVILRIPVFGKMSQYYNIANFCRTVSLLLKSDVRIVNAVGIAADSSKNVAYERALRAIAEGALHGQRMSTEMRAYPALFPPLVVQMVGVGESTGNLSDSLMYLSEMYESEINDLTKNLTNILEPFLMVSMGLIVGFIAISIITPIYGITQNLQK